MLLDCFSTYFSSIYYIHEIKYYKKERCEMEQKIAAAFYQVSLDSGVTPKELKDLLDNFDDSQQLNTVEVSENNTIKS